MTASIVVLLLAKVTLVAAIGLAAAHAARHSRAAVRHVLLEAVFVVLLVLPIASAAMPSVRIAVPMAPAPGPAMSAGAFLVDTGPVVSVSSDAATGRSSKTASQFSLPPLVIVVWTAGTILYLCPLVIGLWQMRSMRRSGVPWRHAQLIADVVARDSGIGQTVAVLSHPSAPGPMTFGIRRQAIILPADAIVWEDEDLRRAIVHELEHIRRRDWLTQCVARVVCAFYWFHPLVWMARGRFALEAERACDDAVLRHSEATSYADQLVRLARQLSATARPPLLAMANRADLSARVAAVLDDQRPRGPAGFACVVVVCVMTGAIVGALSPLRLVAGAQSDQTVPGSPARQRYDAASIKRCEPEPAPTSGARGTAGGTNAAFSPGRFNVPCVTTEQLIYLAYASYGARPEEQLLNDDPGTASNPQKVRGGPDWVHSSSDKYAIEATAPGATERYVLMGAMLRTLLEERFQLKLHREKEEVPMYNLTVARSGFKLKPMKEGDCEPDDGSPVDPNAAKPRCGNLHMMNVDGVTRWTFGGFTITSLTHSLSRRLKVHVIDRTNIPGSYIIRLEFQHERLAGTAPLPQVPSVFTALEEELGLKLEKTTGPREYLVIDHIQRPTPNEPSQPPARASGAGPGRPRR